MRAALLDAPVRGRGRLPPRAAAGNLPRPGPAGTRMGVLYRALVLAAALALAPLVAACASWEGARLYTSGSRALDQGDSERAIRDLERAAELAPEVSEVQNHLGIAYLQAGRRDDALAAFERAVVLDCSNAAASANLDRLRAAPRP